MSSTILQPPPSWPNVEKKRGWVGWGGRFLVYPDSTEFYLDQSNIGENGIEMWSVALTEENIFFQFSDIISR